MHMLQHQDKGCHRVVQRESRQRRTRIAACGLAGYGRVRCVSRGGSIMRLNNMCRRSMLAGAALAASLSLASVASAESTLRAALHSDLKIIDPVWTTALISTHHGMMIYDTLFALDQKLAGQAADGRHVDGQRRQAYLDLHAARRARVARRRAGDGRGLRRLAEALERARRHGPEADELRGRAQGLRRQDLRHEAEGAVRPGARARSASRPRTCPS